MIIKSQLKHYFETGNIPTQAQFAHLIDFIQPLVRDDEELRPNQTLQFGEDGTNPIINGLRIVHYHDVDNTICNYWIFTNDAIYNFLNISIPMFVIKRISTMEPNVSLDMPNLEYAIPTREQLTDWVQQHYNCDTDNDASLHLALTHFTFKPWSEGGGSEFPRIAYINSQSDWDTWVTKFKAAHPEANNITEGPNHWIIDSYTFIIGRPDGIDFVTNRDTYEFFNCTIKNYDLIDQSVILDFNRCAFENCHLASGFNITGGSFNTCSFNMTGDIHMASIDNCNLNGSGTTSACNIQSSDVEYITIGTGHVADCNIQHCVIDGADINRCRLQDCIIYRAKLSPNFIEMIGCNIPRDSSYKNAFNNSDTEIKGFIYGCDFTALESIPGVMKGVQNCIFKPALLSSGVIKSNYFD